MNYRITVKILLAASLTFASSASTKTIVARKPVAKTTSTRPVAPRPIPLIAATVRFPSSTITQIFFPRSSICQNEETNFINVADPNSKIDWNVIFCDGTPQSFIGPDVDVFLKAVNSGRVTIDYKNKSIKVPPIAISKNYTITTDEEDHSFLQDHFSELSTAGALYRSKLIGEPLVTQTVQKATGAPAARDILLVSDRLNNELRGKGLTDTPGVLTINSVLGGEIGREYRSVDDVNCTKVGAAEYRCSFVISVRKVATDETTLAGMTYAAAFEALGPSSNREEYSYIFQNGRWNSPELRAAIAGEIQDKQGAKLQDQRDKWDNDQRKFNDCLRNANNC